MSYRELDGQKGLFNGVKPLNWLQTGATLIAESSEERAIIDEMVSMNHMGDATGATIGTIARLEYASEEAASQALEELQDKTTE